MNVLFEAYYSMREVSRFRLAQFGGYEERTAANKGSA